LQSCNSLKEFATLQGLGDVKNMVEWKVKGGYYLEASEEEAQALRDAHKKYLQASAAGIVEDENAENLRQRLKEWYLLTEENPVAYLVRKRSIRIAERAEREACAVLAGQIADSSTWGVSDPNHVIAAAIRERGKE
jgi:hypothetical protein